MKSKLVKYPYSEKRWQWDSWKQGKKFEYKWDESITQNYTYIEPYIKAEPFVLDTTKHYSAIELDKDTNDLIYYYNKNKTYNKELFKPQLIAPSREHFIYKTLAFITDSTKVASSNNRFMKFTPWTLDIENGEKLYYTVVATKEQGLDNYFTFKFGVYRTLDYALAYSGKSLSDIYEYTWQLHDTNKIYYYNMDGELSEQRVKWGSYESDDRYLLAKIPSWTNRSDNNFRWDGSARYRDGWRTFLLFFILKDYLLNTTNGRAFYQNNINTDLHFKAFTTPFYANQFSIQWDDNIEGTSNRLVPFQWEMFNTSHRELYGNELHQYELIDGGSNDWENNNYKYFASEKKMALKYTPEEGVQPLIDGRLYKPTSTFEYVMYGTWYKWNRHLGRTTPFLLGTLTPSNLYGVSLTDFNYYCENITNNKTLCNWLFRECSLFNRFRDRLPYGRSGSNYIMHNSDTTLNDFTFNITQENNEYKLEIYMHSNWSTPLPPDETYWDSYEESNSLEEINYYPLSSANQYLNEQLDLYEGGYYKVITKLYEEDITEQYIQSLLQPTETAYLIYKIQKYDNPDVHPKYVIDISDYLQYKSIINSYALLTTSQLNNAEYILKPQLTLIGDKNDLVVTIPAGNETVLSYIPGDISGQTFTEKTLKINEPSDYELVDNEYIEKTRTWLTYNSYTANQWENNFHYLTATNSIPWNNPLSPFAYCSGINSLQANKTFGLKHSLCPAGTYINIYKMLIDTYNPNYPSVSVANSSDSTVLTYITDPDESGTQAAQQFKDWCGIVWYFGTNYKTSNNRHEYPDAGEKHGYYYILRPQDTKFIEYFRERVTRTQIEMKEDRYAYTYDTVDFCDRSWEGRTVGTSSSTGENTVPDGTWREYMGLYLGQSVPFLNITETQIAPSQILTQPEYNKEVNTSETLKYGTVASASISFTVNMPIATAQSYNNNYLILYYDFENNGTYQMQGWFYIDTVEAIDENTSRLIGHDEVYKLNKYVDDFMNSLIGTSTLDATYRALLTHCGCQYDSQYPTINNGSFTLYNSYNTAKTTGLQVMHYIAQISPGYIEANTLGDIVLSRYATTNYNMATSAYDDLTYTPFNADLLDKVKILINNTVKGQDSGSGENAYYIDNSPLIASTNTTTTLNNLATSILAKYNDISTYRPATVHMFKIPETSTNNLLKVGDIISITTKGGETYNIIVMTMSIDAGGITITSIGTETYPVEGNDVTSQFINLVNQIDNLDNTTTDIRADLTTAQTTLSAMIGEVDDRLSEEIDDIEDDVTVIDGRLTTAESNITDNTIDITALETLTSGYGVSVANNLASIALNGTTNNIATKAYVDAAITPACEVKNVSVRLTASGSYTNHMYIGNSSHTSGILLALYDANGRILVLTNISGTQKLYLLSNWGEFTDWDIQWS